MALLLFQISIFCIDAELGGCLEGRGKGAFLLECNTVSKGDFLLEYDKVSLRLVPSLVLSPTENCGNGDMELVPTV